MLLIVVLVQACGYTSKTLLPEHIQAVHVPKVTNRIDITGEVTSRSTFQVYRPGLEVELRNAVIERIIFDGHLKVKSSENADAILKMELIEFKRDPLRYNADETIQEFRINIVATADFVDLTSNQSIWSAKVSGQGDYFLSGELARSEDEAVQEALEDLARHVVEGILEVW